MQQDEASSRATYSAGVAGDRTVETVQGVVTADRAELGRGRFHEVAVADRPAVVDDLRRPMRRVEVGIAGVVIQKVVQVRWLVVHG